MNLCSQRTKNYLLKIPQDKVIKIIPFDPPVIDIANKISQQNKLAGIDLKIRLMAL